MFPAGGLNWKIAGWEKELTWKRKHASISELSFLRDFSGKKVVILKA